MESQSRRELEVQDHMNRRLEMNLETENKTLKRALKRQQKKAKKQMYKQKEQIEKVSRPMPVEPTEKPEEELKQEIQQQPGKLQPVSDGRARFLQNRLKPKQHSHDEDDPLAALAKQLEDERPKKISRLEVHPEADE